MARNRHLEQALLRLLPWRWQTRLITASVENRAILRGMGWVACFLLLAKFIGASKEILVAYRYGTSPVVDGYLFVFNLLQWPASIFFSVVSFVLIPYLVKLRIDTPETAQGLLRALVPPTFYAATLIAAGFGYGLWWFVHADLAGLDGAGKMAALAAIPWLAPTMTLAFLAALYSTWLMSQRQHANTLLEAMPSAAIISFLLFWPFGPEHDLDVLPLAAATLLGFALQTSLLARLSRTAARNIPQTCLMTHWHALRGAFGTMLFVQVIMSSSSLVDQFVALRMGEGVLATLSYAQRLMGLILGLTATVISRAMLPVFSGITDIRQSFALARRWAWRCALAGTAGIIVIGVLAHPATGLLFERGAFSSRDTATVSAVLAVLGLQLPFYLASVVLIQWMGAVGKPAWLLAAAVAGLAVKVVVSLMVFDFGAPGLALATVAMYVVSTAVIIGFSRSPPANEQEDAQASTREN